MKIKLVKIAGSDRWYATWTERGRSFRVSTRTTDQRQAEAIAKEIAASMILPDAHPPTIEEISSRRFARRVHRRLMNGSKKGVERRYCHVTEDTVHRLLVGSGGRCAVSGIPFSLENHSGFARNPWAPSVDRIDSSRAYDHDNIRLVCVIANTAMSDWGYGALLTLAEGVVRAKRAQITRNF